MEAHWICGREVQWCTYLLMLDLIIRLLDYLVMISLHIALFARLSDFTSCLLEPSALCDERIAWKLRGAVALWQAGHWRPYMIFSYPSCAAWLLSIFTTIAGVRCGPCVHRYMKINIAHTLELQRATRHPLNKHQWRRHECKHTRKLTDLSQTVLGLLKFEFVPYLGLFTILGERGCW